MDTYLAAGNKDDEDAGTFHAFKGSRYSVKGNGCGPERIDWILLRDRLRRIRTKSQLIVRDWAEESGIYPSDHYPVLAELVLAGQSTGNPSTRRSIQPATTVPS